MADACRKRDLNEIARLLKMDDDKKLEEQERLRNAYANPNGNLFLRKYLQFKFRHFKNASFQFKDVSQDSLTLYSIYF